MSKLSRVCTVKQAAEVFGVSTITIRRLIATGKLAAIRIGRSVRIDRRLLEEILSQKGGSR